jgi:hypothetical protein
MRVPTVPRERLNLVVCPSGHEHHEFYDETPPRPNCSKCGMSYISACGNCRTPYKATDYETEYHSCGAKIPWATASNNLSGVQREVSAASQPTDSPENTEAFSQVLHKITRVQEKKVEDSLRKLVRRGARLFGRSVNKGLEAGIAKAFELLFLALLTFALVVLGLNPGWLQRSVP